MIPITRPVVLAVALSVATPALIGQAEWPGFRGPSGGGMAVATAAPVAWSDTSNRAWRTRLPGAGASSPIVAGSRVFVTSYDGYGFDPDDPGHPLDLVRRVTCVDRGSGKILWTGKVPSKVREVEYAGMVVEHGYASHTPVTDGTNVYGYFGRNGIVAFGKDGKTLWERSVGTGTKAPAGERGAGGGFGGFGGLGGGGMQWGSCASPVLAGSFVVVNAADSSNAIYAIDKKTGKVAWKHESDKIRGAASSPVIVGGTDAPTSVIVAVSGEVMALDPKTGKVQWTASTGGRGAPNPTPVADDDQVYIFGGMGSRGTALKHAADTDKRAAWQTRQNTDVPSPVLSGDLVFTVDSRGIANVINTTTGEPVVNRQRLEGRPGSIYASPVIAGGKLYVVSRTRGTFVYTADKDLKLLSTNTFEDDQGEFNGTPAIVGGEIYMRSDNYLYCVRAR